MTRTGSHLIKGKNVMELCDNDKKLYWANGGKSDYARHGHLSEVRCSLPFKYIQSDSIAKCPRQTVTSKRCLLDMQ